MSTLEHPDLSRIQELDPNTLGEKFPVRRRIVETTLYSAYFVPTQGTQGPPYDILVIDHLPVTPVTAFIWCRRIQGTGTKMEVVKEITNALDYMRKRRDS
ncbi:hypothetical protein [Planococcus alpniumensis]|uniref:hypothetical protein n=1 Tax=Planococcus alpniumensis TaxID=2708345 RepID=UPI001B8C9CF0|nr:hypothetical protein [Planococcus sp. MSAK28401]